MSAIAQADGDDDEAEAVNEAEGLESASTATTTMMMMMIDEPPSPHRIDMQFFNPSIHDTSHGRASSSSGDGTVAAEHGQSQRSMDWDAAEGRVKPGHHALGLTQAEFFRFTATGTRHETIAQTLAQIKTFIRQRDEHARQQAAQSARTTLSSSSSLSLPSASASHQAPPSRPVTNFPSDIPMVVPLLTALPAAPSAQLTSKLAFAPSRRSALTQDRLGRYARLCDRRVQIASYRPPPPPPPAAAAAATAASSSGAPLAASSAAPQQQPPAPLTQLEVKELLELTTAITAEQAEFRSEFRAWALHHFLGRYWHVPTEVLGLVDRVLSLQRAALVSQTPPFMLRHSISSLRTVALPSDRLPSHLAHLLQVGPKPVEISFQHKLPQIPLDQPYHTLKAPQEAAAAAPVPIWQKSSLPQMSADANVAALAQDKSFQVAVSAGTFAMLAANVRGRFDSDWDIPFTLSNVTKPDGLVERLLVFDKPLIPHRLTPRAKSTKFYSWAFRSQLITPAKQASTSETHESEASTDGPVSYDLWQIGRVKVLVRSRTDTCVQSSQGQLVPIYLKAKPELLWHVGKEEFSQSAIAKLWTSAYLRRGARLGIGSVDVVSHTVVDVEMRDGPSMLRETLAMEFQPVVALKFFEKLVDEVLQLPFEGAGLVRYLAKSENVTFHSFIAPESNAAGLTAAPSGAENLHEQNASSGATDLSCIDFRFVPRLEFATDIAFLYPIRSAPAAASGPSARSGKASTTEAAASKHTKKRRPSQGEDGASQAEGAAAAAVADQDNAELQLQQHSKKRSGKPNHHKQQQQQHEKQQHHHSGNAHHRPHQPHQPRSKEPHRQNPNNHQGTHARKGNDDGQ
ncbi:hypothetical protein CAOG_00223 [Capsaspora owczarzaki ATCC 30864]|nr:hypothetical protein CAOG_00223 [Capsaspora owczarzaki ATCC 30864]|eukprot:XP_004365094.2 hypothetical protein CAOG_00223 [Capsaspora owczarzaki ATCC 30864]